MYTALYTHTCVLLNSNIKMQSHPIPTCSKNEMKTQLYNDNSVRESQVKFAHQFRKTGERKTAQTKESSLS